MSAIPVPIKTMFLYLVVNNKNDTRIGRTSMIISCLNSINRIEGYPTYRCHKNMTTDDDYDYILIIGPMEYKDTETIKEIEKTWERDARKLDSRLKWGWEFYRNIIKNGEQHKQHPNINIYVRANDVQKFLDLNGIKQNEIQIIGEADE
jgi:hypothetical protein